MDELTALPREGEVPEGTYSQWGEIDNQASRQHATKKVGRLLSLQPLWAYQEAEFLVYSMDYLTYLSVVSVLHEQALTGNEYAELLLGCIKKACLLKDYYESCRRKALS